MQDEFRNLDIFNLSRKDIELTIYYAWGEVVVATHKYDRGAMPLVLSHALGFMTAMAMACPFSDLRWLALGLKELIDQAFTEVPQDLN